MFTQVFIQVLVRTRDPLRARQFRRAGNSLHA